MAAVAPQVPAEAVAAPRVRVRTRPDQPRVARGVVWIVAIGILLVGIVFLNVVVLRMNIRLDHLGRERAQLQGDNTTSPPRSPAHLPPAGCRRRLARISGSSRPIRARPPTSICRGNSEPAASELEPADSPAARGADARRCARRSAARVWLQVVRAPALERLAAQQHHEVVTTPAGRGTIFDRMGVQLAIGEQATTVYADPRQVRNAQRVAVEAGHSLNIDPNKLYPLLRNKKQSFVYVARKANPARAAALQREGLAGLDFYPEERRFYPQHTVGAQVLGYAGVDNNGLAGLELGLDRWLAGKPGKETIVRDPFGRTIDVVASTAEQPGRDVFLTLDHTLQAKVESILQHTVAQWHALDGTAIVLDPQTGGVLAMAVAPNFDANAFPQAPDAMQRNRAVTDTYEPGSTFKIVTYGAALSDGVVNPTTRFTLPPRSTSPTERSTRPSRGRPRR